MNTFTATVSVPSKTVGDQIDTAFEGGSTYWVRRVELIAPACNDIPNPEGVIWWGRDALYETAFDIVVVEDEPHTADASPEHHLTPEAVQRGLSVMVKKYGQHFGDMISENGDAITADVFLQCCLFGDIVYG